MTTHNDLVQRIEALEKKNRRLLGFGAMAFGALAIGGLMSMRSVCDEVSAERFVLHDAQGKRRAVLTAYETGGAPAFMMLDTKGKPLAKLSVEANGAYLTLADGNGDKSVRYGVDSNGAPTPGCDGTKPKTCDKKDDAVSMR